MNHHIVLRDYQKELLSKLDKAWKRHRSVMVQMPTGTGKTVLMAEVVKTVVLAPKSEGVLVVAHRRELIEQIKETLGAFIDMERRDSSVIVESVQKLSQHISEVEYEPLLVMIDEAHHALANTYRLLWERWPKAKFLGLTATPCRLNNAPFTDLFDRLLQSWDIQEFIDKGYLSDFEYVSASPDSRAMLQIRQLQKRGADGDYQTKEMATVMDCLESIEHLYQTYRQFANGKKGIVYAIDRQHALHITDYYSRQGVRCAMIDAKTPTKERLQLEEEYRQQLIDVLVNVDIFSEGFDCPEVEFIQLARPTLSLSKYLQQVGRGMRVSSGKPHVLILDNVGLYQMFGLPTEERDWRRTFNGQAVGKGDSTEGRYVVLDGNGLEKELVNLEMVRIKKGGKKQIGLEIFLKNGCYGVMNSGRVTCQPRFKKIVPIESGSGYFAAGIYGGTFNGSYVEYASLIDKKGQDQQLRLFRNVEWRGDFFYSYYQPDGYKPGDWLYSVYWDPKGNCYYDEDPRFKRYAGVETALACEHYNREALCRKLRWTTGNVSPRFQLNEVFYNSRVIVARDYLIVKKDHNHAYTIKAYLPDSVLVQLDSGYGYQQIFMDGKKGELFRAIPPDAKPSIFQVKLEGLKRL